MRYVLAGQLARVHKKGHTREKKKERERERKIPSTIVKPKLPFRYKHVQECMAQELIG